MVEAEHLVASGCLEDLDEFAADLTAGPGDQDAHVMRP